MIRLLLLVPLVVVVGWLLYWFRRTPAPQVARTLRKAALWGLIVGLVLAAATGRLNPLFALLGALVPAVLRLVQLAQVIPAIRRLLQSLGLNAQGGPFGGIGSRHPAGSGGGSGQVSSISTRFIAMRLDHATGTMEGEVLSGPFAGRRLADLDLDSLLRMLELYRESDGQSASLLETYLDRERGTDWRRRDPGAGEGGRGTGRGGGGPMAEPEAWSILGLKPGSDADAVRAAHRRLMQKLHPDRGGSDYLAAKINEAKRVLLKERG